MRDLRVLYEYVTHTATPTGRPWDAGHVDEILRSPFVPDQRNDRDEPADRDDQLSSGVSRAPPGEAQRVSFAASAR